MKSTLSTDKIKPKPGDLVIGVDHIILLLGQVKDGWCLVTVVHSQGGGFSLGHSFSMLSERAFDLPMVPNNTVVKLQNT
jgi:hypothetical protein